ncbi:MAG: EscF/YscF/HrpA family type III secretion system needle major subunit [Planctomycetota bacterium]
MSFRLDDINSRLGNTVGSIGSNVQTQLNNAQGGNMTEVEMINMQHELNKWSMMVNLQTNILKTMSDAMKSIVGNMR